MAVQTPVIPETIRVHLGRPNQAAKNVTVPFIDYIKNVASSEIYPTWPDAALEANILVQITYALNRIYTEWYRCQGYDFDITNSTQYDQSFVENRSIFENISEMVDNLFNNYLVREGQVQPFFAQYCNGTTSTCAGLSQWGTVDLANQGMEPLEIIRHYYGPDINIIMNAPVQNIDESYLGIPLRLGDARQEVTTMQRQLNRISNNYPAIPKIPEITGVFGVWTENAVRAFQRIFNLQVDGIVGKATWYKIKGIYNAVMGLSEMQTAGLMPEDVEKPFGDGLGPGDTNEAVQAGQYYLDVISFFDADLPTITITGIYDGPTEVLVRVFQQRYGLPVTGIIDDDTWTRILQVYQQTLAAIPLQDIAVREELFPGRILAPGMKGDDVEDLQVFLQRAAARYPQIPVVSINGLYDAQTTQAVRAVQEMEGVRIDGFVGPFIWGRIVALSKGE